MGHIPEENALNEYLALGLGISNYLECTACFSSKVSKIPSHVGFVYFSKKQYFSSISYIICSS